MIDKFKWWLGNTLDKVQNAIGWCGSQGWLGTISTILIYITVFALVIGVVGLVILWPLVIAWAINAVFGTAISYTFKTWIAMLILLLAVNGAKLSSFSKKKA
jgi:hypothetical protein